MNHAQFNRMYSNGPCFVKAGHQQGCSGFCFFARFIVFNIMIPAQVVDLAGHRLLILLEMIQSQKYFIFQFCAIPVACFYI